MYTCVDGLNLGSRIGRKVRALSSARLHCFQVQVIRARWRAKRGHNRATAEDQRSEIDEAETSRRHGGPPATGGPERERELRTRRWRTQHRAVVVPALRAVFCFSG